MFKKHRASVATILVLRRVEEMLIILLLDSMFLMNKGGSNSLLYKVEYILVKKITFSSNLPEFLGYKKTIMFNQ